MISVKVKADKSPLGVLKNLPKSMRSAVKTALKDTVSDLTKLAVSETSQKYYLTKGQIKGAMRKTSTGFKVSSGMLSLEKYKLMPKTPRKTYVLRGAVKRESGIKPLGMRSFLMKLPSGGYKPTRRLSWRRLPVKVFTGPSIAQAVGNDETGEMLQERAEELFTQRINEYLSRIGVIK